MKSLITGVLAASTAFGVVAIIGGGCSSSAPKSEEAKTELKSESQTTLAHFKSKDSSLDKMIDDSAGYVVFPSIGKGGVVIGGAYGRGEAYEKGKFIGYAEISQASIGATLGGQEYAELIVFQTPEALYKFKQNNLTFGADASAVALKSGAAAATEFKDGVAVFTEAKSGLMASAALTGQKINFLPKDVADAGTASSTTKPAK